MAIAATRASAARLLGDSESRPPASGQTLSRNAQVPPQGTLVKQAMDAVTRHIKAHELRVGDSLPGEEYFAKSLGVSRPVMREAFGALAALQLLDVGNGRKPRVCALSESVIAASLDHALATAQITVLEVWDVRRTLEIRTAALAAEYRTGTEASKIMTLAEAMANDCADLAAMTRHDIAFHQAIAQASHNALFKQIVGSFGPLMETAVPRAWRTRTNERQRSLILKRHRDVARAIHDQQPEAAAAAMDSHFDASISAMFKHID